MANATLIQPTGTQTGMFNIGISIDVSVMGVGIDDFTLNALTGNGIIGVNFTVVGTEPDTNFNLAFILPNDKKGSFEVSFTGMVTRVGESQPEAVVSNTVVVLYDTLTEVTVVFGDVDYRTDGSIILPVTFDENVISPSKSVFPITRVYGDNPAIIEYYIVGIDAEYDLVFLVPGDIKGGISVGADGYVLKESTEIWDNIVSVPKLLAFGYN